MVAKTRLAKRYNEKGLQQLLARVVAVADKEDAPVASARRVYNALLRAQIGDLRVADEVIDRFQELSDAEVQKTQDRTLNVITQVAVSPNVLPPGKYPAIGVPTRVQISLDKHGVVEVIGDPGMAIGLQTALLVRRVGPDRIRVCDCYTVFVAVGKRQFCSETCQKRVYMRKFRAGEVGDNGDE